jgi:hypothetical protein
MKFSGQQENTYPSKPENLKANLNPKGSYLKITPHSDPSDAIPTYS